jgi:hypothetical protein
LSGCTAGHYDYETGIETICQNCPTNCKHCTDAKTCYKCNEGYHLYKFNDNVHCLPCLQESQCPDCVIQGCIQCQIHNDSFVCADCPEGQVFNGKTCTDGCKNGLTGDNCTQTTSIGKQDSYNYCHDVISDFITFIMTYYIKYL